MISRELEDELFDLERLPDRNIVDLVCDVIDDHKWMVGEVKRLDALVKIQISKEDFVGALIINRIKRQYELDLKDSQGVISISSRDLSKIIECLRRF